jgi:YcxB-like protein
VSCIVQLTRRDYTQAYRHQFWRALWWIVAFAPLMSFFPLIRAAEFRHELQAGTYSAIGVASGLYVAVAGFLALSVEICARSFSSHAIRKEPQALGSRTLTFSNEGLRSVTSVSSSHIPWAAFQRAIETPHAFQLYLGPHQYMLLPCDRLKSAQQRDQFRTLLKLHLGDRAKFQG